MNPRPQTRLVPPAAQPGNGAMSEIQPSSCTAQQRSVDVTSHVFAIYPLSPSWQERASWFPTAAAFLSVLGPGSPILSPPACRTFGISGLDPQLVSTQTFRSAVSANGLLVFHALGLGPPLCQCSLLESGSGIPLPGSVQLSCMDQSRLDEVQAALL